MAPHYDKGLAGRTRADYLNGVAVLLLLATLPSLRLDESRWIWFGLAVAASVSVVGSIAWEIVARFRLLRLLCNLGAASVLGPAFWLWSVDEPSVRENHAGVGWSVLSCWLGVLIVGQAGYVAVAEWKAADDCDLDGAVQHAKKWFKPTVVLTAIMGFCTLVLGSISLGAYVNADGAYEPSYLAPLWTLFAVLGTVLTWLGLECINIWRTVMDRDAIEIKVAQASEGQYGDGHWNSDSDPDSHKPPTWGMRAVMGIPGSVTSVLKSVLQILAALSAAGAMIVLTFVPNDEAENLAPWVYATLAVGAVGCLLGMAFGIAHFYYKGRIQAMACRYARQGVVMSFPSERDTPGVTRANSARGSGSFDNVVEL